MSKKENPQEIDPADQMDLKENNNLEQEVQEVQEAQEAQEDNRDNTLVQLEEDLKAEKDRNLRLFADFENFRKRTARERRELYKTAGEDIIVSLLPVLDDFGRALRELEKSSDEGLFKGVELINNKIRETLRSKGLEMIEVKPGDSFDAEIHDAVTQIAAPEKKLKGKIIDVVENGYSLGGKIIRYPKVVIGQ